MTLGEPVPLAAVDALTVALAVTDGVCNGEKVGETLMLAVMVMATDGVLETDADTDAEPVTVAVAVAEPVTVTLADNEVLPVTVAETDADTEVLGATELVGVLLAVT